MTRKRKALWTVACLVVVTSGGFFALKVRKGWQEIHRHCIKVTGIGFRLFVEDNAGNYPTHTNGWGDALLLLAKSNYVDVAHICGPNDDGSRFLAALTNGTDVAEELCSRVYVQGLGPDINPTVCMLFDRKSFPGGDHRYGEGKPVREYIDNTGSMGVISDDRWPEFSREQVTRLMELGFSRGDAEAYFPDAKQR